MARLDRRNGGPRARRTRFDSGTPWAGGVGYSRALRVGDRIFVSGTTATGTDGKLVGGVDPYRQAIQALENVERALRALGGSLLDVVRTRMYVRRIEDWPAIGRAHARKFDRTRPASTLVQVAGFVEPGMLVEIEADAVVTTASEPRMRHRRSRAPPRR